MVNPSDQRMDNLITCPVCHSPHVHAAAFDWHMQHHHPVEWTNLQPGKQIRYYPCKVPGCDGLADNISRFVYAEHVSRDHGIDAPWMVRTTDKAYLERKNNDILVMHAISEAAELNELNTRIRDIEQCFAVDPPVGGYTSCHGLDVQTPFGTSLVFIPQYKHGLVAYLQMIRNTRNQVGSLYTKPGVMDTLDGVLNDLESLLDPPDDAGVEDLKVPL